MNPKHIGTNFDDFLKEEGIIDVYECFFYRKEMLDQCLYYPKGCNSCLLLTKVGEEIDDKQTLKVIKSPF